MTTNPGKSTKRKPAADQDAGTLAPTVLALDALSAEQLAHHAKVFDQARVDLGVAVKAFEDANAAQVALPTEATADEIQTVLDAIDAAEAVLKAAQATYDTLVTSPVVATIALVAAEPPPPPEDILAVVTAAHGVGDQSAPDEAEVTATEEIGTRILVALEQAIDLFSLQSERLLFLEQMGAEILVQLNDRSRTQSEPVPSGADFVVEDVALVDDDGEEITVTVIGPAAGRRRAGHLFGSSPTTVTVTQTEFDLIQADPGLSVSIGGNAPPSWMPALRLKLEDFLNEDGSVKPATVLGPAKGRRRGGFTFGPQAQTIEPTREQLQMILDDDQLSVALAD